MAGVVLSAPVIPLCGVPLTFAMSELERRRVVDARTFAVGAFALAWILSVGVEIVFVRDVFDNRMNTLFKFYYQTWTLYALATGVSAILLWKASAEWRWGRAAVAAASTLAILLGIAYPLVASYQWTEGFTAWSGLDGLAYGAESSTGDVDAIRWLAATQRAGRRDPGGGGLLLPAIQPPAVRSRFRVHWHADSHWLGQSRAAMARRTSPTLLDQIRRRQEDVAAMYADPQSPLFTDYHVRWLVVGPYEAGDWRSECATAGPYPADRHGWLSRVRVGRRHFAPVKREFIAA